MDRYINRLVAFSFVATTAVLMINSVAHGQQKGYLLPPQNVVDIIDAKVDPGLSISPDTNWILMLERDAMPGIADISRRMLQLGGLRIDPVANSSFSTSFFTGLSIRSRDNAEARKIALPQGSKLSGKSFGVTTRRNLLTSW